MSAGNDSYLDRLLTSLEVHIRAFAVCRVRRGYRLVLGGLDAPLIHFALKGSGTLQIHGGLSLPFAEHDFLVIPRHLGHSLTASDGHLQDVRGTDALSTLEDALLEISAGRGADAVTVCGTIEATYGGALGLFDALREPIAEHIAPSDPLRTATSTMVSELAAPSFGTRALVEALLKQCLVLLIRRQLCGGSDRAQWFFPTGDRRLAAALATMLTRPSAPHTLRDLANAAGMSRSAFALHFAATFGQPPMEFLRDLRLRHAARLLEVTNLPVQTIAKCVGYTSRSYFTRAFRVLFGTTPRTFRATRR
ncbi:MAG: AraC family transcriptional regulator [Alphaproteobacteria bacterium]